MERKYILTHKTFNCHGYTGYIIQATRDFGDVKKGDFGGAIQNEANLSHDGNCWIYPGAMCVHKAVVSGNAAVMDNALVAERAQVSENARVAGSSEIREDSRVYGSSSVTGTSVIRMGSKVYGNAMVHNTHVESSTVCDNANLDECSLFDGSVVYGDAFCTYETYSDEKIEKDNHDYDR